MKDTSNSVLIFSVIQYANTTPKGCLNEDLKYWSPGQSIEMSEKLKLWAQVSLYMRNHTKMSKLLNENKTLTLNVGQMEVEIVLAARQPRQKRETGCDKKCDMLGGGAAR